MRYSPPLMAALAVIFCVGTPGSGSEASEPWAASGTSFALGTSSAEVAVVPAVQEFELPFDLPLAPDSRLDNADEFEGPVERIEGHGALATTGSWRDVMAFYEQALIDAGFEATRTVETENGYSLNAERGRDRFRIYPSDRFADLVDGETGLKYVASWDK